MIYLIESFKEDKDTSGKNNPPLAEEGVQFGKRLKYKYKDLKFSKCFSSYKLKDFSSALILVGDYLIVERCHELDSDSDISSFIKKLDKDKDILIVADNKVIKKINNLVNSKILL